MSRMYVDTSCSEPPSPLLADSTRRQRAWGRSRIVFRQRNGRTSLARLYQEGAAKIRLPRTFDEAAEAVLINTAGGMTGGDRFSVEAVLLPGARAVLTTQACERIYRSVSGNAEAETHLEMGAGARLDWLPQETIMFDGGQLSRRLEADLTGDAQFLAVESVIFGRQAMGETVRHGCFRERWRIRRGGKLIFGDDLRFEGAIAELTARPAVLRGRRAIATVFLAAPECERLLDRVRVGLGAYGGASAWDGKLLVRLAAPDGYALRRILLPVLSVLTGKRPLPQVWQS
jgi:urease accessory protein